MRKLHPLVWLTLPALFAFAQDAPRRFAGTWQAKLKDKVICTITLEGADPVTGNMRACNIRVNDDGELIEPESSGDATDPIIDPKTDGDKLSFAVKDEDNGDPLKFELKLIASNRAELRFLNAPVAIKPIPFEKK
jgi:hypothetical protein